MIRKKSLDLNIIKEIFELICNKINDHYPQNMLTLNENLINKIKNNILPKFNKDPSKYIAYYDFLIYVGENKKQFKWHTDSSDNILLNNDIFNIGIHLLIKKTQNAITGIKYVDPIKNQKLYETLDNKLERSYYLLEGQELEDFKREKGIILNPNEKIINDFKNNFVIYDKDIIIDEIPVIETGDVFLFNSSCLHKTHDDINTPRITLYIKFCKKNNKIKKNLLNLYESQWKSSSRLSASIISYGNNLSVEYYKKMNYLLRSVIVQSDISVQYPECKNDDGFMNISSCEGICINIDDLDQNQIPLVNIINNDGLIPSNELKSSYYQQDISEIVININDKKYIPLCLKYNTLLCIVNLLKFGINLDTDSQLYLLNNKIHIFEILLASNYLGIEKLFIDVCIKINELIVENNIDKITEILINNLKINIINNSIGKNYPYKFIKNNLERKKNINNLSQLNIEHFI